MPAKTPMTEETIAAYLDGELSPAERREFERLLGDHPEWRAEVASQAALMAAIQPLKVKPPRAAVWDGYWEQIDERLARRTGQSVMYAGAAVLLVTGAVLIILLTPNPLLQLGEALFFAGLSMLFALALRGRLREAPKDRYRRIRR
ncbi:MAG: zf-HC2 domain-containing protein [Candidatus Sumerlaeia bacterium]|nr:zf-HC2 domain-containing protein [Candidatus Sumerlaeia bacterium]